MEATGKKGVYDLELIGQGFEISSAALGYDCSSQIVVFLDSGFFRNDTLILDNGQNKFWCYLQNDTLSFSAASGSVIEKMTKI